VALESGGLVGFEALARWPGRGSPGPAEFIPVAEDTGLIGPVGEAVLTDVCEFLGRNESVARVAMNLSARQFLQPHMTELITMSLARAGVDPNRLGVEITEGTAMRDPDTTIEVCQRLRGFGVGVAVDDFGTGYSSLSYLHRLPLSDLKVDSSFVRTLGASDPEGEAIVATILALSDVLGIRVVAEGIETEEQREMLLQMGCSRGQGWLFSAALDGDDAASYAASAN
jgi:diguanylate cyclase